MKQEKTFDSTVNDVRMMHEDLRLLRMSTSEKIDAHRMKTNDTIEELNKNQERQEGMISYL